MKSLLFKRFLFLNGVVKLGGNAKCQHLKMDFSGVELCSPPTGNWLAGRWEGSVADVMTAARHGVPREITPGVLEASTILILRPIDFIIVIRGDIALCGNGL